jgi:hypothetical protein
LAAKHRQHQAQQADYSQRYVIRKHKIGQTTSVLGNTIGKGTH